MLALGTLGMVAQPASAGSVTGAIAVTAPSTITRDTSAVDATADVSTTENSTYDLNAVAPVDRVQQGLQVRAGPGCEDRDGERHDATESTKADTVGVAVVEDIRPSKALTGWIMETDETITIDALDVVRSHGEDHVLLLHDLA